MALSTPRRDLPLTLLALLAAAAGLRAGMAAPAAALWPLAAATAPVAAPAPIGSVAHATFAVG